MEQEILTPEMKESLRESFKLLRDDVNILLFTRGGENEPYNNLAVKLVRELSALDNRIRAEFHSVGDEASRKYKVQRGPTLLVSPEKYGIRFTGAPLGEEGRSLVMSLIMASSGMSGLSEDSRTRLGKLEKKRKVRVFTSPT
jgi:thioredoxin reductase (NADPH)